MKPNASRPPRSVYAAAAALVVTTLGILAMAGSEVPAAAAPTVAPIGSSGRDGGSCGGAEIICGQSCCHVGERCADGRCVSETKTPDAGSIKPK